MRNDLPTIAESAEKIQQIIDSTTRKRSRQRLQALFLIQSGKCVTRESVATELGVHRHTVSRWLSKYEEGGLDEMLEIRTRPNRKRVVPDEIYEKLAIVLRENPEQFSSYRDVQAWLKTHFALDVKYKTLYRLIRYELKFDLTKSASTKAAKRKSSPASELEEVQQSTASTGFDSAIGSRIETDVESAAVNLDDAESDPKEDSSIDSRRDETKRAEESEKSERPIVPEFKRRSPTVANFFRSVASLLDDDLVESTDVVQAVRAAHAILKASPPFGFYGEAGGETYLPVKGRKMQHGRHRARRELRHLQSSANKDGLSPKLTRDVLNRLADEFDQISFGSGEVDSSASVSAPRNRTQTDKQTTPLDREPDSIFIDDDSAVPEAEQRPVVFSDSEPVDSLASREFEAEYIVLFAEEDDITASIVKRQLGKKSASLIRATSSKEVFEALAAYPVDLMVINTRLDEESGLDLLRKLRDEPAFDNIPIVAVGWPEDVHDEEEVFRYGADEYMSKPFSPAEFAATVVRLLVASRAAVQKRDDRSPVKIARIKPFDFSKDKKKSSS